MNATQFLARETASPCVDNRPMVVGIKPDSERDSRASCANTTSGKSRADCMDFPNDEDIGLFSDEVVVNYAP